MKISLSQGQRKMLARIVIVCVVYAVAMVLQHTVELPYYVSLPLFSAIYLAIGFDIVAKAAKNILRGKVFDEFFLMTIATIGAFFIDEYADAVAVMLLYQIGEFFQGYAVGKSRKSISDLMNIAPKTATVLRDGKQVVVHPEEVKIGEIIVVKAGENVPLDGDVCQGVSTLNLAALTGESLPRDVKTGDSVLSGSLNLNGVLQIVVSSVYEESTVARILELVENASDNKAQTERFITKFSRFYTPVVVILAVLLVALPTLFFGQEFSLWLKRGLMFLFVSCPCALVISVPMSFFGGIGGASKRGILIKGSNFLELLAKTQTFVFDKTGTITAGVFEVVEVIPFSKNFEQEIQNDTQKTENLMEQKQIQKADAELDQKQLELQKTEILLWAGVAESQSTHPIAQSISKVCPKIDSGEFEITEVAGQGILAKNHDTTILCGNAVLMRENGVEFDEVQQNGTIVYTAKNGKYLGAIVVADVLKPNSKGAIELLHKQRAKTVMLTGDNALTAGEIAQKVGVKEYFSQLLPQNKVEYVDKLIKNSDKNSKVAFVGDGINDAPVLMRADVGIAMGAIGSDSAIEAADIVLMQDNLMSIVEGKKIAVKTLKIVKQNIVFALAIKAVVLVLSAVGLIDNMIIAILADVGVSVGAVFNAMRAAK